MKRRTILVLMLTMAVLLLSALASACTDLGQSSQATTTGAATTAAESGTTLAVTTTGSVAVTSTTHPPITAATTTTSTTLGGLHISPGALQTMPSMLQVDANLLIAPTRYEDTHPFLHWEWEEVWKTQTNAACSGASQKFSKAMNSYVQITFQGTGVQLIATKGANGGRLVAHLSGPGVSRVETIDLYSAVPKYQQTVWYSGHLTSGAYAVYFEWDPTNTSGKLVWIDAVDVWGTVTPP